MYQNLLPLSQTLQKNKLECLAHASFFKLFGWESNEPEKDTQ
jgi:hypothetical protein